MKSDFGRCRIEQEQEEKAVRAIKSARKNEERRQSKNNLIIARLMVSGYNPELLEKPYWTDYKPFRLSLHNLVTSKYFE